jgi:hypothetical protein
MALSAKFMAKKDTRQRHWHWEYLKPFTGCIVPFNYLS